jgi:hypothetical protein
LTDRAQAEWSVVRKLFDGKELFTGLMSLPLFLITLPRLEESHEIFKLTSLCYIAIKVEPYKSQRHETFLSSPNTTRHLGKQPY